MFRSEAAYREVTAGNFHAVAGLLRLHGVKDPLDVSAPGGKIRIVDEGYSWLQIAPEGENWWLTTMFDREGNLVQHYFDVTWKNTLAGADSTFEDLYLDVVVMPDGRARLLDLDELDAALDADEICLEMHALAIATADMLLEGLKSSWRQLNRFCIETRLELLKSMPET